MQYEELLVRVKKDYPELRFRAGERFCWRAPRTVVFEQFFGQEDGERGELKPAEQKSGSSLLAPAENGSSCSDEVEVGDDSLLWAKKNEHKNYDETHIESSEDGKVEQNYYSLQLLHEIGHGLLGHRVFKTDVERVKMECAAWAKARELAQKYRVYYDEEFVEDELDTYREWLHRKSKCKKCGATRYQDAKGKYRCPMCENF